MERTLLSRQALAKRWDYESTRAIVDMEQEGIITCIPGIPSPRYSLEEIIKIETLGQDLNPLSPLERRKLENKIKELEGELSLYKEKLNEVKSILHCL